MNVSLRALWNLSPPMSTKTRDLFPLWEIEVLWDWWEFSAEVKSRLLLTSGFDVSEILPMGSKLLVSMYVKIPPSLCTGTWLLMKPTCSPSNSILRHFFLGCFLVFRVWYFEIMVSRIRFETGQSSSFCFDPLLKVLERLPLFLTLDIIDWESQLPIIRVCLSISFFFFSSASLWMVGCCQTLYFVP